MKLKFVINEERQSCDTYIVPDKKWDDTEDIDAILASTVYGNSASESLGLAIINFATWINHGDIELIISKADLNEVT